MSITAVPLQPIRRGSLVKLWLGVGVAILVAAGIAWAGTDKLVTASLPASAFMAKNATAKGVVQTASGLQYEVLRPGEGNKPTMGDVALVHYEGRLSDGKVFDSSYERGQPAPLPVAGMIPGMTEGLQLMQRGGKYRLWIPPELGYGAEGAGNGVIPPNAVLVFDVELLEMAPQAALQAMGGMDGAPHQ